MDDTKNSCIRCFMSSLFLHVHVWVHPYVHIHTCVYIQRFFLNRLHGSHWRQTPSATCIFQEQEYSLTRLQTGLKLRKCSIDLTLLSKPWSIFQFCSNNALGDTFLMIHKLALDPTLLLLISVVSFNSEQFISLPLSCMTLAFFKKAGQSENVPSFQFL